MDNIQDNKELTRKEREKKVREQDILRAARELFIKKGYHDTTLEEIAHHAEFGKGTIYNYFSSKDELFFGIIYQLFDEVDLLAQSAINTAIGGAREKYLAYAEAMMAHSRDNSDLFKLIVREIHWIHTDCALESHVENFLERIRKFWGLLSEPIDAEIRAGRIRPLNAMELAALFEGMVRFQCVRRIERMEVIEYENIHEAAAMLASIFFDGIAEPTSKG